jgi:hypothetical protein
VHPGGQFTVDFGPVEGFQDSWDIRSMNLPGNPGAGCRAQVKSCTFQVPLSSAPTNKYILYELDFQTVQNGAFSNDYLAVVGRRALTGYVKTPGGRPVVGASVSFDGPGGQQTTTTDDGGAYGVVLTAATYQVRVVSAPGSNEPATVSACSGHATGPVCTVDLASADGKASFTVPAATVTGVIVDEAGHPQTGVTVDLTGRNDQGGPVSQQTTTDEGGKYTFGPSPGTYTVLPVVPLQGQAEDYANGFKASSCPGGTRGDGECRDVPVPTDVTAVVDFVYGCGVDGVRLDSVEPVVSSPFGAVPYTTAKLTGKGFCPNMKVDFGNDLAETTVDTLKVPLAITEKGTQAEVTVARLATSGTVTVVSDGQKATLDGVPIDSFRNVNGVSFPNFSASPNTPRALTEAMFQHVFSAAANNAVSVVKYPGGHIEALTPQAEQVFRTVQAQFGGGVCFGFSLAVARMAPGGDLTPADLGQAVDSAWKIKEDQDVDAFLDQLQLTQWSTQVTALESQAKQTDEGKDGTFLMNEIRADLGAGPADTGRYGTGALILIWHRGFKLSVPFVENSGHAVLAYEVEEDNSGTDHGIIDVYDPNQPFLDGEDHDGSLHQAIADRSRVTINSNGTWSFPGLGWSGDAGEIAVLSESQVLAAINAGLTFANPGGVKATPAPGTIVSALTAPDGKAVDLSQGGSQGVVVIPPLVGASSSLEPFTGPVGAYEERLTGKGALSETLQFNGYQVTVNASPGTDKVVFDTATSYIAVGPAATGTPSTTASVTVDQDTVNGGVQSATVTGSPRSGPLSLGYPTSGEATVTGSAQARNLDLTLSNQQGGQVPQRFSASLHLPAHGTALVNSLNWAEFKGASLSASIGSPGKLSKTVLLKDQARPQPGPRVRQLRVIGHSLLASIALPALPPGSTVNIVTAFMSHGKVEREVKTALTHLGRASVRSVHVHVPARLATGSTVAVTLIAMTGPAPGPVTTTTATIKLAGVK